MLKFFQLITYIFLALSLSLEGQKAKSFSPEVLSLGAAIVDHFFLISDEQLRTITSEKGTWAPIDYLTLCGILEKNANTGSSRMMPGGSGVNVIKGLAQLKHRCAVVGKIGNDEKKDFFLRRMRKLGIETHFTEGKLPTGQAICFVTPDAKHTFRTYMGASHSLTNMEFDNQLFEGVSLFHIEGFQLVDRDLIIRALKQAKKANVPISIDLANVEVVRRNKKFLLDILPKYIDILFCNEEEAKALSGFSPKEACSYLSSFCKIAVVTMSERGSWTQSEKTLFYTPTFSVNAIDTTGAGDLFASGFLHGYLKNEPLQKCAWLGSLISSYIVKILGAEIPDQIWAEIRSRIEEEDPFKEQHLSSPTAHQATQIEKKCCSKK